jgi:transposase-like protein
LAIGDGALGFWNAISKVYPETRHQRCWVHKTANILNKLPKSVQPKVKEELIRQAVNAELEELLGEYSEQKVDGKQAVIRNGFLPERTIQTGLGFQI